MDAIAEAAEDRGPATYQASRPYAEDAGTDAGLYYLGESRAVMDYAAFVRSLTWSDAGRRPVFRSIAPELLAFDREMTARYEAMDRKDHPTYIRASAALKQARSLDDHVSLARALLLTGQPQEAAKWSRVVVERWPTDTRGPLLLDAAVAAERR